MLCPGSSNEITPPTEQLTVEFSVKALCPWIISFSDIDQASKSGIQGVPVMLHCPKGRTEEASVATIFPAISKQEVVFSSDKTLPAEHFAFAEEQIALAISHLNKFCPKSIYSRDI